MAISNTKPYLLPTQIPLSFPLMVFISFLLLLNRVKSDSLSFNIPTFPADSKSILFIGDASASDGVIALTRKDKDSKLPLQNSVGRAIYYKPVQIHERIKGKQADFTTEFSFVVNPIKGVQLRGDGLSFFLAPYFSAIEMPKDSGGGFLGLFSSETALNTSKNKLVAVEFDSFINEWDINANILFGSTGTPHIGIDICTPHIGIDINSIKSVATVEWKTNFEADGAIAKARISYLSATETLSVFLTYPSSPVNRDASLSHTIDLSTVLPEWVAVGFSAANGDVVETHDILSWTFTSSLWLP